MGQVRREAQHLTGEMMVEMGQRMVGIQQAGGQRLMVQRLQRMEARHQTGDQSPMVQLLELRMAQAAGQRLCWPPFSSLAKLLSIPSALLSFPYYTVHPKSIVHALRVLKTRYLHHVFSA